MSHTSLYHRNLGTGEPTQVVAQYVWGARPGHRDELILRDRNTTGDGTLDERLYCLMDYFNPVAVVDAAGVVKERYAWSAFGLRTVMGPDWAVRAESAFAWDFGFHGQFLDQENDWYDYGYRYYRPQLGRWLSRDPIGEQGGMNLYGLVKNNAPNVQDLFGLSEGSLLGNERIKIVVGPHGPLVNGVRSLPNSWVGVDPITSEEEVERNISLAKSNYSNSNHGISCPWNNYEIILHGEGHPMTLSQLQSAINSGADYYLLLLHGSNFGHHSLVDPSLKRDSNRNYLSQNRDISQIVQNAPTDVGLLTLVCCHSSEVVKKLEGIDRPVALPYINELPLMVGHFMEYLRKVVELLCCAAVQNNR